MEGLSKREIKVISSLEFEKKYFFKREDIATHFENKTQMKDSLHRLQKKGRIIKLNKSKYYLVPIKARTGRWAEHPYALIDEMLDGEDYFMGGWAAANYWRLTDQIPMRYDVWTTKRQGRAELLGTKIVFHRTTARRIEKSDAMKYGNHGFRVLSKEETEKWMKKRE
jgi:predicted transcriptional regulator of viral defense system